MVYQTLFDSNRELNLVTLWTLYHSIILLLLLLLLCLCVFYGSYKIAPEITDREDQVYDRISHIISYSMLYVLKP